MQSITTRYICATNTKPSRIVAASTGGTRIYRSYEHELNSEGNHSRVARLLAEKLDWHGVLQGGHTKDGMVWVFIDEPNQIVLAERKGVTS